MIAVSLTERGSLYGRTQYFDGTEEVEEVYITSCGRCLGIAIFWVRKDAVSKEIPQYALSAFHLPPYDRRSARAIGKWFFKEIGSMAEEYDPVYVSYCGRRTETPQNKVLCDIAERHFLLPFLYRYPAIVCQGYEPLPVFGGTTMYIAQDLSICFEVYH